MATVNKLSNTASVVVNGATISSNAIETTIALPPTLTKNVDKTTAAPGELLTYTITISNIGLVAYANVPFTDTLPEGCTYLKDSFLVNGMAATPTVTSNKLTYTIPALPATTGITILFQVKINAMTP